MRRTLLFALKIAISAALLYWAFRSVDLAALRGHFEQLDLLWAALAVAALLVQIGFAGIRWSRIATQLDLAVPPGRASRFTLIAAFFNQALPSTIGGDAMRVWLVGRADRRWKQAIYSVLVDRIAGVGYLALIVAVCLPWSLERILAPEGRFAILAIGLVGVAAFPAILVIGGWRPKGALAAWRLTRTAFEIAAVARQALFGRGSGPLVAGCSIIVHFLTVFSAWSLARAIALSPNELDFLSLIPPVMLIAMIPISVGGWGIRENAMVVAFGYAGIAKDQALAVSVLIGLTSLVVGAIGGAAWLSERRYGRVAAGAGPEAKPHA